MAEFTLATLAGGNLVKRTKIPIFLWTNFCVEHLN